MQQVKVTTFVVVLLIAAIVILQNLEPVETQLVITSIKIPLAALLISCLAIGYVLGLLTPTLWRARSRRNQAIAAKRQAEQNHS